MDRQTDNTAWLGVGPQGWSGWRLACLEGRRGTKAQAKADRAAQGVFFVYAGWPLMQEDEGWK